MPKDVEELKIRQKLIALEKQFALLKFNKNNPNYESNMVEVQQELNLLKKEYRKYKIEQAMKEKGR